MSGIACAEPETWELSDSSVGIARALEPNPGTATGTTLAEGSSSSGAMQSPGEATSTDIGEWRALAQVAASLPLLRLGVYLPTSGDGPPRMAGSGVVSEEETGSGVKSGEAPSGNGKHGMVDPPCTSSFCGDLPSAIPGNFPENSRPVEELRGSGDPQVLQ